MAIEGLFGMVARLVEVSTHHMRLGPQEEAAGRVYRIADCEIVLVAVNHIELAEAQRPLVHDEFDLSIGQAEDAGPIEIWHAKQLGRLVSEVPLETLLVVPVLVDDPAAFAELLAEASQESLCCQHFAREVAEL